VLLDRFAKLNVSRRQNAVVGTVVPALYAWCLWFEALEIMAFESERRCPHDTAHQWPFAERIGTTNIYRRLNMFSVVARWCHNSLLAAMALLTIALVVSTM